MKCISDICIVSHTIKSIVPISYFLINSSFTTTNHLQMHVVFGTGFNNIVSIMFNIFVIAINIQ